MAASSYNTTEMNQARQLIGGEAGKFGAVGDGVPTSVAGSMFGSLSNSGALAQAASALCSSLRSEYSKAESLVGDIERTLDTNMTSSGDTEQNNKQTFTIKEV